MNPYAPPKSDPEQKVYAKNPRGYERYKKYIDLTPPLVVLPRRCIYTNKEDNLHIYESLVKSKSERCYVNFCVDKTALFRRRIQRTVFWLLTLALIFILTSLYGGSPFHLIAMVIVVFKLLDVWVILKSGPLLFGKPSLKKLSSQFLQSIPESQNLR